MWTIAAANKKLDGPLGTYNGLTDVHLAHYFSTPTRQSHLKAAKLIKSDGTIIPCEKVKMASLQHEKKKKHYDILASTVIQNATHKESSWNKKLCRYLEDILKMENVEKVKGGSINKLRIRSNKGACKEFSVMPLIHNSDVYENHEKGISTFPRSANSSCKCCFNGSSSLHHSITKLKRSFSAIEASPYASLCGSHACKFQLHSGLQQFIKPQNKKKKCKKYSSQCPQKVSITTTNKVNRLSIPDQNFNLDQCKISLHYHGHTPLTNCSAYITEEVLIRQQHCGGTSVVVYKGKVSPKDILTFTSLTHEEFSFSITLFLDGIRYLKLSSCCVFRYSPGKRLGGSSGSFSIHNIQGGKPCEKCQYRQFESSNKDMKPKLMNSDSQEEEQENSPTFQQGDNKTVTEYPILDAFDYQKNHKETEDSDSSVVSEIINSQYEEFGDYLKNDDVTVDNVAIEDEEILEDANVSSVNEIINDSTENNTDSESTSSIADSVKNCVRPEIKPYTSESSDDEDIGKQHVVLASIHGTPNRGT